MMRILGVATTTVSILLAGCNSISSIKPGQVRQDIDAEMQRATENRSRETAPDAVSRALVPPLTGQIDAPAGKISESRFDLSVSNAPASQVFMAIVSGTRYSMLVNPEVTGSISVNLKDVTVMEALDTIRELYGYEYRVQGTRIFVQPLTMQSRVFKVNYLTAQRMGRSDTREALRHHFEVDAGHVVVAVLSALAEQGGVQPSTVAEAIARYAIDPDAADPLHA